MTRQEEIDAHLLKCNIGIASGVLEDLGIEDTEENHDWLGKRVSKLSPDFWNKMYWSNSL